MPLLAFTQKSIILTGASAGIGAEVARQVSVFKPRLTLAARNLVALEVVAADCRARGAEVACVVADMGIEAQARGVAAHALEKFGAIDFLINNAGVSGHALFEEVTDFKWYEDMMRVNHFGPLWLTHAALPALKRSKGLIVGVSSLAGKTGVPGRTAYSPSKFATAGFFETLRIELLETGVDVTMIFPGVVLTDIRLHGYGPDGKPAGKSGLKEEGGMTVEDCAAQMLVAMANRRRELVMTPKARFALWLKLLAPGLVDKMARAALK